MSSIFYDEDTFHGGHRALSHFGAHYYSAFAFNVIWSAYDAYSFHPPSDLSELCKYLDSLKQVAFGAVYFKSVLVSEKANKSYCGSYVRSINIPLKSELLA